MKIRLQQLQWFENFTLKHNVSTEKRTQMKDSCKVRWLKVPSIHRMRGRNKFNYNIAIEILMACTGIEEATWSTIPTQWTTHKSSMKKKQSLCCMGKRNKDITSPGLTLRGTTDLTNDRGQWWSSICTHRCKKTGARNRWWLKIHQFIQSTAGKGKTEGLRCVFKVMLPTRSKSP